MDLLKRGSQGVGFLRLMTARLAQRCHSLGIPAVFGSGACGLLRAAQNLQDSAHTCPHLSGSSLIWTVNLIGLRHLGH